jgi:Zn-finger nucleic acid-binding protein
MPILLCPNCNVGVQQLSRNGVQLDVCPQCRGVWLDRGELEKLLGAVREAEAEMEREGPRRRDRDDDRRDRDRDDDDDRFEGGSRRKGRLSRVFDIFGGGND